MAIYEKIKEIQEVMSPLVRDTKGFNYKYPTLLQLQAKLKPLLRERNIQKVDPVRVVDGKSVLEIKLIDHDTEEKLVIGSILLGDDISPQDKGKAITYYRRYLPVAFFDLEVEDEDAAGVKPAKPVQTADDLDF